MCDFSDGVRSPCLKKNLNASTVDLSFKHKGENVKTFSLGGIIGCKDKISSWHLNGFYSPMVVTLLGQQYPPVLSTCYNHFIPLVGVGKRDEY